MLHAMLHRTPALLAKQSRHLMCRVNGTPPLPSGGLRCRASDMWQRAAESQSL
eukprot:CAMPEP_0181215258 /NCGR_PEP_ID=MMETSP1096-20121128/25916_1 /TAXON_ID=156174 ORGANISM="Chrysochromulina ericina, Strain CCMP281" /NCGR_SAMPLE_ID=MMETSP1096 /ASSEMBLY_ACC=CAM_ASM_000453 /LENGTH=52 /DNA_ID=CAMNT_0023307099 /DNA_START=414 /DNA_END=572 /DNA_ORIENTATION=+